VRGDIRIRLARPDDAEAFHRVEIDAAQLLAEEPSLRDVPIPPAASPEEHARVIGKGRSLTALSDDHVVGFAAAAPIGRDLHLHELSVARNHQRRGIGATLLRALAIDARNSGYRAITLNTFRDIAWNAPFYARHGFAEIKDFRRRRYLSDALDAAVALGLPRERRCAMIRRLD